MPEKPSLKARLNVCGIATPTFGLEKKPTFKPKLTSTEAYCMVFGPLFYAYRLYLPLMNLLTWVADNKK